MRRDVSPCLADSLAPCSCISMACLLANSHNYGRQRKRVALFVGAKTGEEKRRGVKKGKRDGALAVCPLIKRRYLVGRLHREEARTGNRGRRGKKERAMERKGESAEENGRGSSRPSEEIAFSAAPSLPSPEESVSQFCDGGRVTDQNSKHDRLTSSFFSALCSQSFAPLASFLVLSSPCNAHRTHSLDDGHPLILHVSRAGLTCCRIPGPPGTLE